MRPRRDGDAEADGPLEIECADCASIFVVTVGEQDWFKGLGWAIPRRCKPCRDARKRERDHAGA